MAQPLRRLTPTLRLTSAIAVVLLGACASTPSPAPSPAPPEARIQAVEPPAAAPISEFFASFTDEWMRRQPSASTGSRYFDGQLQDEICACG